MSLDDKVREACHRIEELYHETEGHCYVSFSGGKDSTLLLALVKLCEEVYTIPENGIPAVFCNTGVELGITYEFVRWVRDEIRKRLIDLDDLLKELEEWEADLYDTTPERQLGVTDAIVIAIQMPTVIAKPVRHGKWMPREEGAVYPFWERYTCSACGKHADDTEYCPHCGARMDEDETN